MAKAVKVNAIIPFRILLMMVCVGIAIPVYAQSRFTTNNQTFSFNVPVGLDVVNAHDTSTENYETTTNAFKFELPLSIIDDDRGSVLLSNHTGEDLVDGQIIVEIVLNEDYPPFASAQEAVDQWFYAGGADEFEETQFGNRDGMIVDLSIDEGPGLYGLTILNDGIAVFVVAAQLDPSASPDELRPIVDTILSSMAYTPATITPLDSLPQLIPDRSLLTEPIQSDNGRFEYRAPQGWDVSQTPDATVTVSSTQLGEDGLPESALEFFVQPISKYVRQPDLYIVKAVNYFTDKYVNFSNSDIKEFNFNGRRMVEVYAEDEFTGLVLSVLIDDDHYVVMNGVASAGDLEKLQAIAYAVADSIQLIEYVPQAIEVDASDLTETFTDERTGFQFRYPAGGNVVVDEDVIIYFSSSDYQADDFFLLNMLLFRYVPDDTHTLTLLDIAALRPPEDESRPPYTYTLNGMAVAQLETIPSAPLDEFIIVVQLPDNMIVHINAIGNNLRMQTDIRNKILSTLSIEN